MREIDEFDRIVDQAFGPEVDPARAPVPPTADPGCIRISRFKPEAEWSEDERVHLADCRKCQRRLSALWEVRCPGYGVLLKYHRGTLEPWLQASMKEHASGPNGCRKCSVVGQVIASARGTAAKAGAVARLFRWPDLGFADAAVPTSSTTPLLIVLPEEEGFPVEVSIWEEGGELRIRGVSEDASLAGSVLAVDLWDDRGSHPYRVVFKPEANVAIADNSYPMRSGLNPATTANVVAVAWTEEPETWR